jgi:hypothetical protein
MAVFTTYLILPPFVFPIWQDRRESNQPLRSCHAKVPAVALAKAGLSLLI